MLSFSMKPLFPHLLIKGTHPALLGLLDVSNGPTGAHATNYMMISTGFIPITLPAVRPANAAQTPGQDTPKISDSSRTLCTAKAEVN